MAEACKSRVHQLIHDRLKSTKTYLSEHVDARSLVEQAQRNVREFARKAEQRIQEATGRKDLLDVSSITFRKFFSLNERKNEKKHFRLRFRTTWVIVIRSNVHPPPARCPNFPALGRKKVH